MVFLVVMYGCESWTIKKLSAEELMLLNCDAGEDSWESLGLQPVHPKGNQSWIFTQRTDAESETPILRPPDVKNWVTGKYPDAGKDWRQEKWMTEDEMVGWYHGPDGHEFDQAPRVSDGQGSLMCFSPWGSKNRTRLSDWTELNYFWLCYPPLFVFE